jgi:putative transcriptional regulator
VTAAVPGAGGLTGQFLVATPEMNDPRFTHTVIYMLQHDARGAMGLIVNRPFKDIPIALLLDRLGQEAKEVGGSIRMHFGGPVDPEQVFILHTADYKTGGTQVIGDGIAATAPPAILRAIGAGAGPRRALLALGYAGWGPRQLEGEIQAGAWFTVPADAALVFDDQYDTKWERAMARRKIDL